jgi:glycine dehydrogenase
MITDLTGLDVANASLLDEATAAAEAMTVARRVATQKENTFFVDHDVHPQTHALIVTRAQPLGLTVISGDPMTADFAGCFGAIFQHPGSHGAIRDLRGPIAKVKEQGGVPIVAADPLALTVLASPAELGAEIALGSTQRFGVPMGYGGPHAAYLAVKDAYKRHMPGRLVGVSIDAHGSSAYRLALQTREQHIRREKATSNICTASGLMCLRATTYLSLMGRDGVRDVAVKSAKAAQGFAKGLAAMGFPTVFSGAFFNEFVVDMSKDPELPARLEKAGFLLGIPLDRWFPEHANRRLVALTEYDYPNVPALVEEVKSHARHS